MALRAHELPGELQTHREPSAYRGQYMGGMLFLHARRVLASCDRSTHTFGKARRRHHNLLFNESVLVQDGHQEIPAHSESETRLTDNVRSTFVTRLWIPETPTSGGAYVVEYRLTEH